MNILANQNRHSMQFWQLAICLSIAFTSVQARPEDRLVYATFDNQLHQVSGRTARSLRLPEFDGRWWARSSRKEKEGYLEALDDCFVFDRKPPLYFHDDYWIKINQYYLDAQAHKMNHKIKVPVRTIAMTYTSSTIDKNSGEKTGRRENIYWVNSDELEKKGFLEGYFTCSIHAGQINMWPQSLTYYIKKLDNIFDPSVHGDSPNLDREITIASELAKLSQH